MFSSAVPRIWSNVKPTPQDLGQQQDGGPTSSPSSQSPPHRSNFKSALEHISVPESFHRGINVFKVTAKGKLESATLIISQDKFIISVLPRSLKLERTNSTSSSSRNLKRPGILSRGRSNNTSLGSTGGGSIGGTSISGTISNSVDGMDASFSFMSIDPGPSFNVDIGSIDRIQSGQNTLLFEKAR